MMENFSLYNSTNRSLFKQIKQNFQQQQQVKTIFGKIPSILLTTFICTTAIAQEYPGCFILDQAGNRKDLTISICNLSVEELSEQVSTSTTTVAGIYQIPIKSRRGGSPVIDVTFNGNQTYEMILDTGASSTLITQEMAKTLKVITLEKRNFTLADGKDVQLGVGKVGSISAGGLTLSQFDVAVAPTDADQELGLLGQNFFGSYDITIKENVVELKVRSGG
ncbi:retropepsin-like aspartic protease [Okeania sp.]|uniref:retropepsin-like aspartic protease family protein n=1 Tax=Okeania sp. TaxID=3100323 RepID=UPI002B4B67BD|nr:retropepsin-like aspartic protease [Okeania sp.]MEB3342288.1 retropepsin-like aspartic protease [Okeania sp.]